MFDILQLLLSHFKYCFYKPLTLKRRICESGHGALQVNAMHVILQVERKCFTKQDVFFFQLLQSSAIFVLVLKVWTSASQQKSCKTVLPLLILVLRSAKNTTLVVSSSKRSEKVVLPRKYVSKHYKHASHTVRQVVKSIAVIQMAAMVVQCLWAASSCLRHAP